MAYTFSDWQSGLLPPKSWDCADACDDGWTKLEIETFIRTTIKPWTPPAEREPASKADGI